MNAESYAKYLKHIGKKGCEKIYKQELQNKKRLERQMSKLITQKAENEYKLFLLRAEIEPYTKSGSYKDTVLKRSCEELLIRQDADVNDED